MNAPKRCGKSNHGKNRMFFWTGFLNPNLGDMKKNKQNYKKFVAET